MSLFSRRNPFAAHPRSGKKKRQRQQKRQARRHLVETLERRDHPGSVLEVSAIALLGRPDGESKDPIDQMLRTVEGMHARREEYERLINLKRSQAAEPFRHHRPDGFQTTGSPKLSSEDRDTNLARRAATSRLLDRHLPIVNHPVASPLLGSISETFLSAGLDQLPDSAANASTGRLLLGPGINAGSSGGGGASGGGGGGSSAPIGEAADQAGTAMSIPGLVPASDSGSSSDASSSNAAASTGDTAAMSEAAAPNADSFAITLPSAASVDTSPAIDEGNNKKIVEPVNRNTPVDGWSKEDFKTGRQTESGFTLSIEDGRRGNEDGVANGVIIDPGGPGYAGSITIGCDGGDPLADWTTNQFGGSDTGHGTVVADGSEILASEGDSLLVVMTRPITVPDDPSRLIVGFEAFFDETADDRINDAFEIALLDTDGYSVVPTIDVNRDSYFNITESVGAIEAENTYHYRNDPDDYLSGVVDLDISNLNPGQELSLIMRLVNNDGDTGSWSRIACDRPMPTATDDFYTTTQDTVLVATDPTLTANDYDEDARTITVVTESVTQPTHGSVSVDPDGKFTYAPDPGYFGDDSFTYHATNGIFRSATAATVYIAVQRDNSPPTSTDVDSPITYSLPAAVDEASLITLGLSSTETVSQWSVDWGDGAHQTISDGAMSATHVYDDGEITHDVHFWTETSSGIYSTDTSVVVSNIDPLLTISAPATVAEGADFDLELSEIDPGEDTIYAWQINWGDGAPEQWVEGNPATIPYRFAHPGIYAVSATAFDEDAPHQGLLNEIAGQVIIETENFPSAADGTGKASSHDWAEQFDSDASSGENLLATPNSGGGYHSNTIIVNVEAFNRGPVAFSDGYVTDAGIALHVNASGGLLDNDYDPDGDTLTISTITSVNPSSAGTLTTHPDGSFDYIPASGFDGQVTLEYTITDGFAASAPATVTITVTSLQEFAKFYVADYGRQEIFKYDDSGELLESDGRFDTSTGEKPRGATSNVAGDKVWTVDSEHKVVVHAPGGNKLGEWQALHINGQQLDKAEGIATNGMDIWIVDAGDNKVMQYDGGAAYQTGIMPANSYFYLDCGNSRPSGITTNGQNLYVLNDNDRSPRVFVYSLSGQYMDDWELSLGPGRHDLQGITTNPTGGSELWVVDNKTDKVYYFAEGTTYRNGIHRTGDSFDLHPENRNPYGLADPSPADFTPTIAWSNATGGNWSDPTNWTDLVDSNVKRFPNESDRVLIDIPGGDFNVTVTGGYDADYNPLPAMRAARLYSSDPIVVAYDGGLNLSGTSEMEQLTISGGAVQSDGNLVILQNLDWSGGMLAGDGTVTLIGDGLIHGTSTKSIGTTFNNDGAVILQDYGALEIGRKVSVGTYDDYEYYPGTLHNRANGTFEIQSDADITDAFYLGNANGIMTTGGLLHNEGTLKKTQGADVTIIGVPFENDGSVNANAVVSVESGTLQIRGSGVSSGQFIVGENRTLQLAPQSAEDGGYGPVDLDSPLLTLTSEATLSGEGTLQIGQGVSEISGDVNVKAIVINSGGVNFNGSLATDSLHVSEGEIRIGVTAPITVDDVTISGGILDNDSGLVVAREFLVSGTPTIQGDAATQVTGSMQMNSVPWSGNPELFDHTLLLQGTTDWVHGRIVIDGASQIINSGVFNITGDGSVTVSSDEYGTPSSIASFINEGTINHHGTNNFAIDIPFQSSGTVYVAPNKTLALGSPEPVVVNDGLFTLDNATLQLAPNYYTGSYGILQIHGGQIVASGHVSGSIENRANLAVSGSPSTLKVDGNFTQTASGTTRLRIQGPIAGSGYDQIQVDGLISLDGDLEVLRDWETQVGDQFTLLINDDDHYDATQNQNIVDPVLGNFAEKLEWKSWVLDNEIFRVTYKGGTGNEIILRHSGPGVEVGDVRVNEGSDPNQRIEVPVTLDIPSLSTVSIDYATENRLAIAGIDYQQTSGTLVLAPGQTEAVIEIVVPGNRDANPTRDFFVALSSPVAGTILDDMAQVIIVDDDYSGIPDNLGKEFFLAIPENANAYQENPPGEDSNHIGFLVVLVSEFDTSGNISAPWANLDLNFDLVAGETQQFYMPASLEPIGNGTVGDAQVGFVLPTAIRISADHEIAVYGLAAQFATTDGFMVLPSDTIGKNYILTSYPSDPQLGGDLGTQFQIIGTVDRTRVTITATDGTSREVQLNRGDVFSQKDSRALADFTGTRIHASEKVAVISGNTCANVPVGFTTCDTLIEQLPPLETLGKQFILNKLASKGPDIVRVVAVNNSTVVSIGETQIALSAGEVYETTLSASISVVSNQPIQLAQFATGSQADQVGDPFMILVPPTEQFLSSYILSSEFPRSNDNYLGLTVPNSIISDITINGDYVDPTKFVAVAGTDFSVANLSIDEGGTRITGPLPFGVTAYGYSYDESYGYIGGQAFVPIDVTAHIHLDPDFTRLPVGYEHDVIATVTDHEGNALIGVRVDYTINGPNAGIGSVRTDAFGLATILVNGQLSGLDTITATAIGATETAQVEWFSATPTIDVTSPPFGYSTGTGQTVLISGRASSGSENATIVSLTIDGQRIASVDAAGNFFTSVEVPFGKSSYEFEAINSLGASATTVHSLEGLLPGNAAPSFDSLVDVSAIVDLYATTSYDERLDQLYAELSIVNNGAFPISNPLWVGVHNVSDPSVEVIGFDGLWDDGTPYYDLSSFADADQLLPGSSTFFDTITFHVPERRPFDYQLVLLGAKNEAPAFASIPVISARGGVGETYAAKVTSRDPDGDAIALELFSGPQGMTFIDNGNGTGQLTWDNVPADLANYPVSIRASDSRGATTTQSYVISIVDGSVNRPPVFTSHPVTGAYANQPYTYDSSARDADGDRLAYSLSVFRADDPTSTELAGLAGSGSVFTIDPNGGEINWLPSGPDAGHYSVVITADDGRGGIANQRYALRLNPVEGNHAPVVTSSPTASVTAGTSFLYQASAVDPDEDSLTFSLQSAPSGASMTATGLLSFEVPSGINVIYDFAVKVTDGNGNTTLQIFTIAGVDATPATLVGRVYHDADGNQTFDSASDIPLVDTVVYLDANTNLHFDVGETSTTTDAAGLYTISSPVGNYRVGFVREDQWATVAPASLVHQGATSAAEIVNNLDFLVKLRPPLNSDPQITTTPALVARFFEPFVYDVDATDPDGDSLIYELIDGPDGVTINSITGVIRWLPEPQVSQVGAISVRVSDDRGGFARQNFFPEFTFVNEAPVITSRPTAVPAVDVPFSYQVTATDLDGDVLLYSVDPVSESLGVTIDPATGWLSWTPVGTTATDVTVNVNDGRGSRASQTFTLNPTLDAFPVLDVVASVRVPIGIEMQVPINASDSLGDAVTVELQPEAIASGAQIVQRDLDGDTISETVLVFTPPIVGRFTLPIVAFDPAGQAVTSTVVVHAYDPSLTAGNQPPTDMVVPTPMLYRDQPVRVTATVDDPDQDPILWSIEVVGDPAGGPQINPNTGVITWTPATSGNVTVMVTAADIVGGTVSKTVTYTILENAPPRFVSAPVRGGAVGVEYTHSSHAEDPNDGETNQLVYRANIVPSPGSFGSDYRSWPSINFNVDPNTGVLDWTPSGAGDYFVTLIATDPHGAVGSQSFFVSIISDSSQNSSPDLLSEPAPRYLLSPPARQGSGGVPLDYQARAIDSDNDPLTYELVSGPDGLAITAAGRVRYNLKDSSVGTTGSYTVRVTDGRGGEDTETFTYSVTTDAASSNRSPDITSKPSTRTPLSRPYIYNAEATDPDGDTVRFELDTAPAGASIDSVTGLITWLPTVSDLGTHPITVTAIDIAGAASSQSYTLAVVRGDMTPRITSTPPVTSRAGDYYHYGVNARDDDGDTVGFLLGPGTDPNFPLTIDSVSGILSGTTTVEATYNIEIIAIDSTDRFDSQSFQLTVNTASTVADPNNPPTTIANNHAPTISSAPGRVGFVGSDYRYNLAAVDTDIARGDVLTWSLTSQPSTTVNPINFDAQTRTLQWRPDASELDGLFSFEVRVTDLMGAYSTQSWSVRVRPENIAPVFSPIADPTLVAGASLAVDVHASDANLDAVEYSVDAASIERGITIDELGRLRWSTTVDDRADSPLDVIVTASDGYLSDSAPFTVTLTDDDVAPVVRLTASRSSVRVGEFFDLAVRSSDNVGVVSATLTLVSVTDFQGNVIELDQPIDLTLTSDARLNTLPSHLGSISLVATATDKAGRVGTSDPLTILVFDPSDTTRPQVTLLNPSTGDRPQMPTDILGSVTDDSSTGLMWSLSVAEVGGAYPPRQIASGVGQFTADVIGLFDPTILRDGAYEITLSATDSGNNTASDTEIVDVKTDLKLGNFSLSFTDLQVPVAGMPITITRSYDSLDAEVSGDFGFGWSLEVDMPKMFLSQASTGAPSFAGYPTFVNGTRMTVDTPEGNTEGFTFKWVAASDGLAGIGLSHTYRPSFVPDPDNQYSLVAPVGTGQFRRLTENGPYQDDFGRQYSGQDPTFGGVYQLKQSDPRGKQIDYDILVGTRGTTEMTAHRKTDKYGNSLEVRPDGIYSNRGRSVQFNRDSRGRITGITDPRGGQLVYQYDAAGRLVKFYDRRAMQTISDDVASNEFAPTRFEYDPDFTDAGGSAIAGIENYLTKIIDPLGVTALETQYDPATGRLLALVDADGNPASLDYNITADGATVSSQSAGYSPSQSSFDAYGRLYSEVSASGQETRYTYQGDQRYPYQSVGIIGDSDGVESWLTRSGDDRVTTRQYHPEFDGAITEETDPDGNTTVTAYNTWGYDRGTPDKIFNLVTGETTDYHWFDATGNGQLELLTQADAYGNVTQFGYDLLGNVNQLTQSNTIAGTSITTDFTFDSFGDLVQVIDQDGNIRRISYNENGDQAGTLYYHYPTDQRPPLQTSDFSLHTSDDFPLTRTQLRTENDINFAGDVTGSRIYVTEQTLDPVTLTYVDGETTIRNNSGTVEFDALGRPYRTTDENGRRSEIIFDARGLAIETRTESPGEDGTGVWLVSRTLFDTEGRAIYSTGSFPESVFTDSPEQITGTHSIYDDNTLIDLDGDGVFEADEPGHGTGRMLKSEQLLGINIQLVSPSPNSPTATSQLSSAGTVLSSSRSFYDDSDRVTSTENDYGLRTQTLYDDNSRVIESRSETVASDGTRGWLVSRTIYDKEGKVLATSDRFLVPGDTPLGEDPIDADTGLPTPVTTQITKTIYDKRNRTIATERYAHSIVPSFQTSPFSLQTSAFQIADQGELESVSETLYDAAGRAWRTVSGRVPLASLSPEALAQHQALADFEIYPDGTDRYHQLAAYGNELSAGVITDTLFDDRGRKFASLGHPLPAEDIGLGDRYPGTLVRHRSETTFNRNGRAESQRSGIAQVSESDGTFIALDYTEAIESRTHVDAFSNVVRMDYVVDGSVDSYTQSRFDDENRPIAEMQQTAGNITAVWDESNQTYIISAIIPDANSEYEITAAPGDFIPTKLYHYDSDDRLDSVSLALISPSDADGQPTRPRYHYGYDSRGNQTSIIDPLGRETRFTFTDRGQQESRTLPLGFGPDGRRGTADDPTVPDFAEQFFYDDRGRQSRHVSFEGVVSENVYDDYGRMSAINYYNSESDYEASFVFEREEYLFDSYGRRVSSTRYQSSDPSGSHLPDSKLPLSESPSFTLTRIEATLIDDRGRILHEITPEGTLSYGYNTSGQQTFVAINADVSGLLPADPTSAERVTYNGYDLLNRIVSVQEDATPQQASSLELEALYGFDLQGRMRSIAIGTTHKMPSLLSVTQFDRLGRLAKMTDYQIDPGYPLPLTAVGTGVRITSSYNYTVRPDGKRTHLHETTWLDLNEDGELTANELKANSYSWQYDDLNRLTDEVIDHWDDTFDQTEGFQYDISGNRTHLDRDKGNDGMIDEAITYSYDANDRLLDEVLDSIVDTDDTTTSYTYNHTQQTAKQVFKGIESSPLIAKSAQLFSYNLHGRMSSVTNEAYTGGTLSSRERTSYFYDSKSFRVSLVTETGTTLSADPQSEIYNLQSSITFLADSHNHTGYTQTIRETKVENGHTLITDYTFGHDEISQRAHGEKGDGTVIDQTHVFGHDGHGSVRILYDLAVAVAPIVQAMTYSAYGELLALHNTAGTSVSTTSRISSFGYSGEHHDASAQQQYLRARFYSPTTGRFNRLDPFAGNTQDPQSLHKYAYVHGDPVGGIDPTGNSMLGTVGTIGVIAAAAAVVASAAAAGGSYAQVSISTALGSSIAAIALLAPWATVGIAAAIAIDALVLSKLTDRSSGRSPVPSAKLGEGIEYGSLASVAYQTTPNPPLSGGWEHVRDHRHLQARNYNAREFYNSSTNEVVLAFAGTDDIPDVISDVFQGTFGGGTDYDLAIGDARKVIAEATSSRPLGVSFRLVGHSLGGGLAAAASSVTGARATTFNAAGLNSRSVAKYGVTRSAIYGLYDHVDAFRVSGEFLSLIQDSITITGTVMPDGNGREFWIPGDGDMFTRHKMPLMLQRMTNLMYP